MKSRALAEKMLRKIDTFPSPPTVAAQIIRISSDPDARVVDLKKIIEADSAMAVEVLKVANSPFFGLRRKVCSIEHAISLLGMSEIRNLVLSKAMLQTFSAAEGFDTAKLWTHSFYCALAARLVANQMELDPDELFAAGLIHDIGKLIIYMELQENDIAILEESRVTNFDISQAEEDLVGISHDRLAMHLLKKWLFPSSLVEAVGYHHSPHKAPSVADKALAVNLADLLAHQAGENTTDSEIARLKNVMLSKEKTRSAAAYGLRLNPQWNENVMGQLKLYIQKEQAIILLITEKSDSR